MKSTIGVYDTHEQAIEAVHALLNGGIARNHVTLLGQAELKSGQFHFKAADPQKIAYTDVGIGAVLGPIVGALIGAGVFAVPGLGFLFGAGALVGAIAGLDFGLIGGGIVSTLTILGLSNEKARIYDLHLKAGKYLVIINGEDADLHKAKDILHEHGAHLEIDMH